MIQVESTRALALTLVPVASDPAQAEALHDVLREYCHTVRNRLNGLKITLYLACLDAPPADREAMAEMEQQYQGLERFMDQLQMIYRPIHLDLTAIHLGTMLEDRRESWSTRLDEQGISLQWSPPRHESPGHFDPIRLIAALDGFVTWRAQAASPGGSARVTWREQGPSVTMTWEEPGEPGAVAEPPPSASLALPILARVVAAHGGRLHLDQEEGFRVVMSWRLESPPS